MDLFRRKGLLLCASCIRCAPSSSSLDKIRPNWSSDRDGAQFFKISSLKVSLKITTKGRLPRLYWNINSSGTFLILRHISYSILIEYLFHPPVIICYKLINYNYKYIPIDRVRTVLNRQGATCELRPEASWVNWGGPMDHPHGSIWLVAHAFSNNGRIQSVGNEKNVS